MSYLKLFRPTEDAIDTSAAETVAQDSGPQSNADEPQTSAAPVRSEEAAGSRLLSARPALTLHTPPAEEVTESTDEETPDVVPFRPLARYSSLEKNVPRHQVLDSITRARVIHENRVCPYCSHPTPEPVELRDAVYNSNLMPIPGTATLVGFHCCECDAEWPI